MSLNKSTELITGDIYPDIELEEHSSLIKTEPDDLEAEITVKQEFVDNILNECDMKSINEANIKTEIEYMDNVHGECDINITIENANIKTEYFNTKQNQILDNVKEFQIIVGKNLQLML